MASKQSRFICLKCKQINHVGDGIQRKYHQREFLHVKNLFCINCKQITYNVEIRPQDYLEDVRDYVPDLHDEYYKDRE